MLGTGQIGIRKQAWHHGPFLVSVFHCLCTLSLSLLFSTSPSEQPVIAAQPVAKASSPCRSRALCFSAPSPLGVACLARFAGTVHTEEPDG